jgi:hypothetical protein
MVLDLRRYPDELRRNRWRKGAPLVLAGLLLGVGLAWCLLAWTPSTEHWQERALEGRQIEQQRQLAVQAVQRQHQQAQLQAQREAQWVRWQDRQSQLHALWPLLANRPAVSLERLHIDEQRTELQVLSHNESAVAQLLADLGASHTGVWHLQQQSAHSAAQSGGHARHDARGWLFVLQAASLQSTKVDSGRKAEATTSTGPDPGLP